MARGFSGKRCVIVGGAGGIGSVTAGRLAEMGARICLLDRDGAALERVEAGLAGTAEVMIEPVDAADRAAMQSAFDRIEERWGGLDVHIHIAGLSGRRWGDGPIDECTQEGWDRVIRNNLDSVFLSNQMAIRVMKRAESGSVVNVASVLGLVGVQDHFVTHAYAASKGAIVALSRSMAVYYAHFGLRVNCVAPGLLDTPMSQRATGSEEIRDALISLQPLQPHIGSPASVAEAILFLAGDAAGFITGVTLPVDGGWVAQ